MSDTKQKIAEVALRLFSRRGYTAVSIRDICAEVGIKESSVYYHYSDKRAIFDELEKQFRARSNQLTTLLMEKMSSGSVNLNDSRFFFRVCTVHVENFLLDEFCNAFIRTLAIERFSSDSARQIYDSVLIHEPVAFQSKVFGYLISVGALPQGDAEYYAVQYYSPILLYYEQYMLSGEITQEKIDTFKTKAYAHINKFIGEQ